MCLYRKRRALDLATTRTSTCMLEHYASSRCCPCPHKSATNMQQASGRWASNAATKDKGHIALWTHLIPPIVLALLWRPAHKSPSSSVPSPPTLQNPVQFEKSGKKKILAKPWRQFYALSAAASPKLEKLVCFSYASPPVMNGIVCLLCLLAEKEGVKWGLVQRGGRKKSFDFSAACVKVTLCSLHSRPDGASRPSMATKAAASSQQPHQPLGIGHLPGQFLATIGKSIISPWSHIATTKTYLKPNRVWAALPAGGFWI